jgi:hypothetical protein
MIYRKIERSPPPNPLKGGGLRIHRRCLMLITPAQAERSPGYGPPPYLNCVVVQLASELNRGWLALPRATPGVINIRHLRCILSYPLGGWGVGGVGYN